MQDKTKPATEFDPPDEAAKEVALKSFTERMKQPYREGSLEARMLEGRITALIKANAGTGAEPPHEIFMEICKHAVAALKPYKDDLAESPAAPSLLEYLGFAMARYIQAIESATLPLSATARRGHLATAFLTVGKPGPRISDAERTDICSAYFGAIWDIFKGQGGHPTNSQITGAVRTVYRTVHGEEWVKDDDTAKKRIGQLRKILKHEGYI
jgi:hypothetical protein